MNLTRFFVLFMVILLIVMPELLASPAQSANKWRVPPQWAEFIAGALTGLGGGVAGVFAFGYLSYPFFAHQRLNSLPGLSAALFGLVVGYPLGFALGAGTGVVSIGENLGEDGNTTGAYLGAILGGGVTFYGATVLVAVVDALTGSPKAQFPLFIQLVHSSLGLTALAAPLGASIGATWGYNQKDLNLNLPWLISDGYLNDPIILNSSFTGLPAHHHISPVVRSKHSDQNV
jgi:hypothetical protein